MSALLHDPIQILAAYQRGWFPMAEGRHSPIIRWYEPTTRAIIPLDDAFHIPHGLRRTLRQEPFTYRINGDFRATITACAAREDTWINDEIINAYTELHILGYAHSVESWQNGQLVGGLYGLALGSVFCGESMFSAVSDASKAALVYLVEHLRARNYHLLDSQIANDHLRQFGLQEIPQTDYLRRLHDALSQPRDFLSDVNDTLAMATRATTESMQP